MIKECGIEQYTTMTPSVVVLDNMMTLTTLIDELLKTCHSKHLKSAISTTHVEVPSGSDF